MSSQACRLGFGQVVIGPPGSGKTTYCYGVQQLMNAIGRKCCLVNLDPANDHIPYDCDVNIKDLVTVEDVATNLKLGPNGSLIYCMEYLESNKDWLFEQLKKNSDKNYYVFDCPGQIELYTHHKSLKNVIEWLRSRHVDIQLCAVHLVDSHYCSDPNKFISVLMTSLATMMHMELPHVNILSKMDLAEKNGKFAFNLEYYTEVLDLSKLLQSIPVNSFNKKYHALNRKICELIEDQSLVSFVPLYVEDKESMVTALDKIDRANGFNLGGTAEERSMQKMLSVAVGADFQSVKTSRFEEKYLSN